ncbi:MAG: DUF3261 domain-containing protein [Nitrococcus sp.]|nr:DUF3261 domain-containing protein [Nitrococcus sp.]
MTSRRCLGLLCLTLLMAGCASVRMPPKGSDCVRIGPSGLICLLAPAQLPAIDARHMVTVRRAEQSDTFLGRLRIDREALRLAGTSLFGAHLFTITWDGRRLVSAPADSKMRPRLMLAMLQVALADPGILEPHLYELELEVGHRRGAEARLLLEHGRLVTRIEIRGRQPAEATFDMKVPPAGLTLHLQPLTETP